MHGYRRCDVRGDCTLPSHRPVPACSLLGFIWKETIIDRTLFSYSQSRIDPTAEFTRIRHSLNLLESHYVQYGGARPAIPAAPPPSALPILRPVSSNPVAGPSSASRNGGTKHPQHENDRSGSPDNGKAGSAPGMLGQSDSSGFYAGPTSALSHLLVASKLRFHFHVLYNCSC
jgi:hypothetical protein